MDQRNHFPLLGDRGPLRRYGVSISVALVLALLAAAGGSWGTAFGQSVPTIATPTTAVAPAVAPTQAPTAVPTPKSDVVGSAPVVPNGLPNTGEPPSGSGTTVLFLTVAGVALLLGGARHLRRRAR